MNKSNANINIIQQVEIENSIACDNSYVSSFNFEDSNEFISPDRLSDYLQSASSEYKDASDNEDNVSHSNTPDTFRKHNYRYVNQSDEELVMMRESD